MAAVINKRDAALQAASPRTITVNLGATVNVNGSVSGNVTGTLNGTAVSTVVNNSNTGANHAGLVGNVHNVSLSQISGDLDSIANGVTYFRTTANQVTGAGRAFNALDSSNEYIKSLVSTKMTVVGSNPATGIAIDANGIRMYQASTLKVNIPVSGAPSFSGDITGGSNIDISGRGVFAGSYTTGGWTAAVHANLGAASGIGVVARGGASGSGINGFASSTSTAGVIGSSQYSGAYGVNAVNTGGGYGLRVEGNMMITSTTMVSNLNADMVDGLHASSLAKISGGNSFSGNQYVTGGNLDVSGWVQCDNFRIDQTPSTGSATATFNGSNKPGSTSTNEWLVLNMNGITKYIPAWG